MQHCNVYFCCLTQVKCGSEVSSTGRHVPRLVAHAEAHAIAAGLLS